MHREEAADPLDMRELRLVDSVEQEPMQLRRSPPKLGQLAIQIATKLETKKCQVGEKVSRTVSRTFSLTKGRGRGPSGRQSPPRLGISGQVLSCLGQNLPLAGRTG
jgi:hypothetical protein